LSANREAAFSAPRLRTKTSCARQSDIRGREEPPETVAEFWYDTKYIEIPNVIGLTLKEAKSQLKNLNINYSGNGNIIKSISPEPGSFVKENSTIKILLVN
jgi:hypothetical protein